MYRFVIVSFLDEIQDSTVFRATNWPLHLTLIAPFKAEFDITSLKNMLVPIVKPIEVMHLRATSRAYFGHKHTIPVILLSESDTLLLLYRTLSAVLDSMGTTDTRSNYTHKTFRPHITEKTYKKIKPGDIVIIDSFSIVDMQPENDRNLRKVVFTHPLA